MSLFGLALEEGGWLNWLLFWSYLVYFQLMDGNEKSSGAFAQYYLDPESELLDS